VAEVNQAYQQAQARAGKGSSKHDYLLAGRNLEQAKQWGQAIDNYLGARRDRIDSAADLEDLWSRAIELARNYMPNRHVEVALEVSRRLVDISRAETAADVLFEIGRHEEAINVCLAAKKYDKARALSQGKDVLRRRVEEAYQSNLVSNEDHGELLELGRTDVALDVLAKRGDWDGIWEVAAKQKLPPLAIAKFVTMRADELVRSGKQSNMDEAVKLLHKRVGAATDQTLYTNRRLVRSVMQRTVNEEASGEHQTTVALLREVLYRLANTYRSNGSEGRSPGPSMEDLLMTVHYQHMLYASRGFGLKDIAAKCSVTLLKYPEVLPQDKAFYQAGITCREQGNTNLAFMLLNRCVVCRLL
jgi:intraflagellar transport protein 172